MAPPLKKQRTADTLKPTSWHFAKPLRRTVRPDAARPFAKPVGKPSIEPSDGSLTRQLALKTIRLRQVVDENNKFRQEIEGLKSKLATLTAAAPPPAPPPMQHDHIAALTKMDIQLEEATYELEAQNYFDNRARHYAYNSALHKALKTRPMHQGSRYLALRATLPYLGDLPEGPVIYSIPRLMIPKRPTANKK